MPAPWSHGARVRIVGEIHGSQCINVMHFATNQVISDNPGELDEQLLQLAQAMLECCVETLLPAVTSDYKLIQVDAARVAPVPSDPIIATAPGDSVGQLAPTSVSFAASLVHIRTGGGGRSGRGRIFLPPPGEAQMTASSIDPGTLLLITEFLLCVGGKFMGAGATTPWLLGVLSQKILANNVANFDAAFRLATSLNPVSNTALLSSRKKGHGS